MLVMGGSARDWWDRKGCRVNVHHLKFNHTDNVDDKKHIVMMVTIMISNHNKYKKWIMIHDDKAMIQRREGEPVVGQGRE